MVETGTDRLVVFPSVSLDYLRSQELGAAPPIAVAVNRGPSGNATLVEPHFAWSGLNEPIVPERKTPSEALTLGLQKNGSTPRRT